MKIGDIALGLRNYTGQRDQANARTIGDLMRSPLGQMGIPMPGPISGYGGGTFGMDGSVATPVDSGEPEMGGILPGDQPNLPPDLMAQRPQRAGWKNVLGTVLDAVAAASGHQPQYWTGVRDEQERDEEWNRQLALEQWKTQQRLALDREKRNQPPDPTSLMQNFDFLRQRYGEDFAKDYVMKPTFVQNWDGTRTQVTGGDAPDQLPADFFDQGGPTPNASGGFPR